MRTRNGKVQGAVIGAVFAIFGLVTPGAAHGAAPSADTLRMPALHHPVQILKDRWGISHIYAQDEHDLFFAQGWNAARDRLFQLEIWRRQATGTMAEILGPREIDRDRGARLFMFRRDLDQELRHYHPHGPEIVRAFVDGINAYVDRANRDPADLPMEFGLLGIRPQHWTAADIVSRHGGLLGNIGSELRYGRAVAKLGAGRVLELSDFGGPHGAPDLTLDSAIDGSLLSQDILHYYNAFRRPVEFLPQDIVEAEHRGEADENRGAELERLNEEARLASLPDGVPSGDATGSASGTPVGAGMGWGASPASADPEGWVPEDARQNIGSNNWVVSGSRTESGYPMLANDPHRAQGSPSLRYWVHLNAPGWNVIGAGEPILPGVSIGHNEYGAWGLTVFSTDGEDLYVYHTNPSDPDEYLYQGKWERMTVIQDTIPVKGRAPEVVQLKYTRHGPVVHEDSEHHVAYAVRAAWMEIGGSPYLASLRMDQAKSWEEFRDACNYSNIPGENMVWAGRDGTIGWQAVGIAPIRRNWSGLVPVPGDGRYEWDGYLPIKAKPHVSNPPAGYFATANNDLTPPDYPFPDAIGYEWTAPWRWDRINEVLAQGRRMTIRDMEALQTDELAVPARTLVPLLRFVKSTDRRAEQARQRLLSWNDVLDSTSVAAGIYVAWEKALRTNVSAALTTAEERSLLGELPTSLVVNDLLVPPGGFGDHPIAARDRILVKSLEDAVASLSKKLGRNMEGWRWGQAKYHHALIRHPLGGAVDAATRAELDVGPVPRGGYAYTVNATGSNDNQTSGPSFRIIVDTRNWDHTVGAQNPGQVGDPTSPHYRDLFQLWAQGRYFPAYYSRDKVESVTEETTVLEPRGM